MKKNNIFLLSTLLLCFFSCNDSLVFTKYKTLEKSSWEAHKKVNFEIDINDTIAANNVFINLRNNKDYQFSNIYLITEMTFPDETIIIDTLQYEMANEKGEFLGRGLTDIKENKLFYKEHKIFPQSGKYQINVRHAMRKNGSIDPIPFLEGIQDVGLSIEKVK
ncbi:gliding motility lipoprotein GldH [Polaribacter porphyrae]|uniref:Gliding motility lipoprotein GldH n=1 Tax=Polaribacter porphyrae TaxID=1137780 RepID=A0A2S7WUM7_9FLAO|nr:gliding motility lipoprotein GldH [Polaribacter porphyrae]